MQQLLPQCSAPLREIIERGINKAQWYPLERFVELITTIDRLFGEGDGALIDELARHGAEANLTTIYRLFFKVGTTRWILGRAVRLWHAHYDSGYLEVLTRGPETAILRIRDFDTPHVVHCRSVMGWAQRSIELSGADNIVGHQVKCRCRGDEYCQFDYAWD